MKRIVLIGFFWIAPALALASGTCVGKATAHESFCSGKDQNLCGVHSGVCNWKEQTLEVVMKRASKSCVAQVGQEAHENFCKNHNRQVCAAHSTVCTWE